MGNTTFGYTRAQTSRNQDVENSEQDHPYNPFSLYTIFGTSTVFFSSDPDEEVFGFPESEEEEGEEIDPLAAFVEFSPSVPKIETIQSLVNLNKMSLKLIPQEVGDCYGIQFVLDALCPCSVRIYSNAIERDLSLDENCYSVQAGIGQIFVSGEKSVLHVNQEGPKEGDTYSVNIVVEAQLDSNDDQKEKIVSQKTLATLLKCNDGTYEIKPLEQHVLCDGVNYIIYDIYGIDHASVTSPEECVICMTELRNTVVIPCRHLCLCHKCAQVLHYQSNRCPICRGTVRSMLKIKINKTEQHVVVETESGDSDGDNTKIVEEVQLLSKEKKKKKKGHHTPIPSDPVNNDSIVLIGQMG